MLGALYNATGVNSYTQYGIYEGYTFRGFQDLFPPTGAQLLDGVRNETTNRINTQLTNIDRIEVANRGDVRRAKLYYLRDLRGKAAKIKEKRETPSAS